MQDLLGFWTAVEELKEAEKTLWHQLATEIFYTFINKPAKVIKVEKSKLKQIEAFLLGDSNPDIFHVIQGEVTQTLETTVSTEYAMCKVSLFSNCRLVLELRTAFIPQHYWKERFFKSVSKCHSAQLFCLHLHA